MSAGSGIEWTDDTWNPVTGCVKVSPGCDRCYAERDSRRFPNSAAFPQGFTPTLRPARIGGPLRWRKPRRVFVNSTSDLFQDAVPDEYIARVWAVMALTPRHTFQVLTKRHGRMRALLSDTDRWEELLLDAMEWVVDNVEARMPAPDFDQTSAWLFSRERVEDPMPPLPNVWLGVSVEDQQRADLRIPALMETPAAVRWISAEPLLGRIRLRPDWLTRPAEGPSGPRPARPGLDWVVVGGETGPNARPMHPDWARSLRDQAAEAHIPYFFKQWGEWGPAPWVVRVCDPAVGWRGTRKELTAAKKRAEAAGATHAVSIGADHTTSGPIPANQAPWSLERTGLPADLAPIRRWGRTRAGNQLDGRIHADYPKRGNP